MVRSILACERVSKKAVHTQDLKGKIFSGNESFAVMNTNNTHDIYITEDVTLISKLLDVLEVHHYWSPNDANGACIKLVPPLCTQGV
jgi:hypothetical protein